MRANSHIIILLLAATCGCGFDNGHVQSIDLGHGRTIELYKDLDWEMSQPVLWQIETQHGVVKPQHFLISDGPNAVERMRFFALSSEDSNVVAVLEDHSPQVVLGLYDFTTGEEWDANIPVARAWQLLDLVASNHTNVQMYLKGYSLAERDEIRAMSNMRLRMNGVPAAASRGPTEDHPSPSHAAELH